MAIEQKPVISKGEEEATVSALEKMMVLKNIPQRVFDVFQKVFGGTSLEVVPIRYDDEGNIEIFMIQRLDNDTYWPGELHVPGTMVFAWDWFQGNKLDAAWNRLREKEIIQNNSGNSVQVDTLLLNTKRGAETAIVNNLVFKGPTTSEGGQWYQIKNLPGNVIEHHRQIVFTGVHDFVASVVSGHYQDSDLSRTAVDNMVSQITSIKKP